VLVLKHSVQYTTSVVPRGSTLGTLIRYRYIRSSWKNLYRVLHCVKFLRNTRYKYTTPSVWPMPSASTNCAKSPFTECFVSSVTLRTIYTECFLVWPRMFLALGTIPHFDSESDSSPGRRESIVDLQFAQHLYRTKPTEYTVRCYRWHSQRAHPPTQSDRTCGTWNIEQSVFFQLTQWHVVCSV
jgi:hypothetical protein